ncbi:hypothetical protein KSS87_002864 [Heliosperma pusillum]|nr:hypothetical protein KSS87_002864 [Heliosperma pusillum]
MGSRDIEKNRGNYPNYDGHGPPPQQHQQQHQQQQQQSSNYEIVSDKRWKSWLIPLIVVADIAIFIVAMVINNCPKNYFGVDSCFARFLGRVSFQPLRENPLLGPSSATLLKMGALQWDRVVNQHQGWRLISCIWLHAGVVHLVANMVTLVLIGVRLEQQFGFVRIGILYLVSGFGGSVLSALFLQRNISVGASGALFGLLGAMLAELLTNWTIYANKAAALFSIVLMVAINLAIGMLPHVDNFAHIGGFLTGFLLGFILLIRPRFGWLERHQLPDYARVKTKYLPYQMVFYFIALAALVAGFVIALIMLFKGKHGNDSCSWCHYLDCVPTSRWQCDT